MIKSTFFTFRCFFFLISRMFSKTFVGSGREKYKKSKIFLPDFTNVLTKHSWLQEEENPKTWPPIFFHICPPAEGIFFPFPFVFALARLRRAIFPFPPFVLPLARLRRVIPALMFFWGAPAAHHFFLGRVQISGLIFLPEPMNVFKNIREIRKRQSDFSEKCRFFGTF